MPGFPASIGRRQEEVARDDFESTLLLGVFFYCNHCPYAKAIEGRLIELDRDYQAKGFRFVAVSANDAATYPDDSFASMQNARANEAMVFRTSTTRRRRSPARSARSARRTSTFSIAIASSPTTAASTTLRWTQRR